MPFVVVCDRDTLAAKASHDFGRVELAQREQDFGISFRVLTGCQSHELRLEPRLVPQEDASRHDEQDRQHRDDTSMEDVAQSPQETWVGTGIDVE